MVCMKENLRLTWCCPVSNYRREWQKYAVSRKRRMTPLKKYRYHKLQISNICTEEAYVPYGKDGTCTDGIYVPYCKDKIYVLKENMYHIVRMKHMLAY